MIDCAEPSSASALPIDKAPAKLHGEALGDEEIGRNQKSHRLGIRSFEIPAEVYEAWDSRAKGDMEEAAWNNLYAKYKEAYPELAAGLERRMDGELPAGLG